MANTFTAIIPVLVARALQVLREACTLPQLVNTDFADTPANQGDSVNVWVASAMSASDVTPSSTPSVGSNSAPVRVSIPLSSWKKAGFFLTDKEAAEISRGFIPAQTEEAIRALANQINADLFATYKDIYGYVGTAGTTPFSTANDLSDAINARKVLSQQLAPDAPRVLVLDPAAEAKALSQDSIQKAYARGDQGMALRTGRIGSLLGFDWYADQQVPKHTAGTITTGLIAKAATAVAAGAKSFVATTAASTGACALVVGDVIAIAGHTTTYVMTAAATQASAATDVTLAVEPGLEIALAGSEAITVKATHRVNLAMHRDCIAFASRPVQALGFGPNYGVVADPVSRLNLRLEVVRQHKQNLFEFDVLYGVKCVRPALGVRVAG